MKNRVFSGKKLRTMIEIRMTKSEFVRRMVRSAPEGLRPSIQQLNHTIKNSSAKSNYIALYADVLGCNIDDFYEEVDDNS